MRVARWLVIASFPLLYAGSCRPTIQEFHVTPPVICPGDTSNLRILFQDANHGRMTVRPPASSGEPGVVWDSDGALTVYDHAYLLCESTDFEVKFWHGDTEGECTAGNTLCDGRHVSVAVGRETRRVVADPCASSSSGATAEIEIRATDYSESFEIVSIANCGARTVTLNRAGRDGAPATAERGEAFGGFAGDPWVGRWTASQTVDGGETCPVPGRTAPVATHPPPSICLEFEVGCPNTDACG